MATTIDLERLKSISEGDKEFEQELLEAYINDSRECLAKIKLAIVDVNWEVLAALAHQLKGASGNVGAVHMEQLCIEIERHARGKQVSDVYPALLKELSEVESFVRTG